ncbi:MAG: hypothetical protein E7I00_03800, partial [Varibaculum cambriense]|nr:hypothetical protein [Varibaculum cambriense]
RTMATLEVRAKEDVDVKDVVKLVKQELYEQFKIEHATVGIDWNYDQNDNTCSLSPTTLRNEHEHEHEHEHGKKHNHSSPGHKH